MLKLGAHRATTGGLHNALLSAHDVGCQVVQLFTSSPQQWQARPLDAAAHARWAEARATAESVEVLVAHDSYLINLATADETVHGKSVRAFTDELARCTALGIPYLVTHPGAHVGAGEEAGLARFAESLRAIYDAHPEFTTRTLLETTAGQGTCLGRTFEELAWLLAALDRPTQVAVCLDTCHVFAAGYDLRTAADVGAMLDQFESVIGLERLQVIHLNDSKGACGSRLDRHQWIGAGEIGDEGFRALLTDSRLAGVPMLIETPDLDHHAVDLAHLRALAGGNE